MKREETRRDEKRRSESCKPIPIITCDNDGFEGRFFPLFENKCQIGALNGFWEQCQGSASGVARANRGHVNMPPNPRWHFRTVCAANMMHMGEEHKIRYPNNKNAAPKSISRKPDLYDEHPIRARTTATCA